MTLLFSHVHSFRPIYVSRSFFRQALEHGGGGEFLPRFPDPGVDVDRVLCLCVSCLLCSPELCATAHPRRLQRHVRLEPSGSFHFVSAYPYYFRVLYVMAHRSPERQL